MKPASKPGRILLAISSLSLIACYWLPLWDIYLWAPQYPEGLKIEIWFNNLLGDVDVINGLNHYIGMKHLKPEMFPEFQILGYLIAAVMVWGLFTAWQGSRKSLGILSIGMVLAGIVALADFYRWGYDYGHNLDPSAPIQVPGMAYQPPVIGYKDLLNFTALSIPGAGGWLFVGFGAIAIGLFLFEWKIRKGSMASIALLFVISFVSACNSGDPKINFGKDDCHFCSMKLMDKRFGLVAKTEKGKSYVYDDINCMKRAREEQQLTFEKIWIAAFDQTGELIPAEQAILVESSEIRSPMASGIAAFKNEQSIPFSDAVKSSGQSLY